MPNDDETREKASNKVNFSKDVGLQPIFEAGVRASIGLQLRTTPRINCGIKIGGDIGVKKEPLVLAQVAVYMNTTLYFEAYATAETTGLTSNWEYGYKVELWWRVVLDADAELYLYSSWKSNELVVVDWQTIPVYGPIVVKSSASGSKARGLDIGPSWDLSDDPLPNPVFGKAYFSAPIYKSSNLDPFVISGNFSNSTTRRFIVPLNGTKRSTLYPRAEAGEENEFMLGDFKCTTGNSPCDSNDLESRGLDPFRSRSWLPTTEELERRQSADCRAKIPRLYCKFFSSLQSYSVADQYQTTA